MVFILNVTSYANDYAVTRKRKVLAPEDVFQALSIIESDNITAPLMDALGAWKTNKANKSGEAKKRKAEKKNALTQGASNTSVPFSITLSEELRLKNAEHG
ncbi:hypothetical protein DICVIV_04909 [Dictyocaulus viviparus]|uniref:Transcription factor CBF/NF-Y/archaeal histone domain-containing protein n=1 Tax=Dictyocaulus viviparus TaxID=29172 RepID=A0A0D8XYV4_DICVI|nr:hypothetical protein DICVIV_04909 [Dictyocaulus viviparus]